MPGRWARLSATPLRAPSPAPRIGQHGAEVLAEPRRLPAPAAAEGNTAPFEGLRVLDLSWVGVGPMTAGYLANQGATVIKVESSARPDILRLTPPFLDGRPGLNNSHFCANMNASKAGLGVDLARPEGRAVVWRIIEEWADVVLESFTPRTLRGWGMDWAAVSARRPDIVMLSTCMQGQTGPRADYRGFGNLMGALSGFYSITGWPDRPPVTVYGAYTDFICQRFATTAITAAIDHRRRTGAGQYIDLAQLEAALQFLGPEFLDLDRNGHVATRAGNRDPERCPHVVLPCRPDADGREGWLALACEDDGQWAALVDALGRPAWATDPALVTVAGRKAAEDRIEAELAAWSAGWDAVELFERLQPAIPCGPVLAPARLHTDPQVRHRSYFVPLRHSVMGEVPYDGVAAVLSATPARLTRAAPCLGEDTFTVLTELIGMDPDEVAQLLADGVVEITG
ncbi:MAG: CoA transferase [Acidimicrobiales bacterium]